MLIFENDRFKHSRIQLELTNVMGKRRITELEKECENLRNCLHYVLEENKRGRHLTGEPELKSSMEKLKLEQQAKGLKDVISKDKNVYLYDELARKVNQLTKQAEDL